MSFFNSYRVNNILKCLKPFFMLIFLWILGYFVLYIEFLNLDAIIRYYKKLLKVDTIYNIFIKPKKGFGIIILVFFIITTIVILFEIKMSLRYIREIKKQLKK